MAGRGSSLSTTIATDDSIPVLLGPGMVVCTLCGTLVTGYNSPEESDPAMNALVIHANIHHHRPTGGSLLDSSG